MKLIDFCNENWLIRSKRGEVTLFEWHGAINDTEIDFEGIHYVSPSAAWAILKSCPKALFKNMSVWDAEMFENFRNRI